MGYSGVERKHVVPGWQGLLGIMMLRLVVLTVFLIVLTTILPGDNLAFYSFMAIAFIVTIPYSLWLRNRARVRQFATLQFLVDLTVVTGLVYFTGGIKSDLTLLYPLIILSAGLVTTPRQAMQVTVLCAISYSLVVVLMNQRVLLPFGMRTVVDLDSMSAISRAMLLRMFVFGIFGFASVYVAKRCDYVNRQAEQFKKMTELIFNNVRAGLLMLDESGRVLLANQRACNMIAQPRDRVIGALLTDYLEMEGDRLDVSETQTAAIRREHAAGLPVSLESSALVLPNEMIAGHVEHGTSYVRLVVMSDISRVLELQKAIRTAEQVKMTERIAAQIAHEVRNPLAAISGAVQVLQVLEGKAVSGDETARRLFYQERTRLNECVVRESERLTKVIEKFLNYAECSTESLSRLIEFNEQVASLETKRDQK